MEQIFEIDDYVHTLTIHLIDNNPYQALHADIWTDESYMGTVVLNHFLEMNDYLGRSVSMFRCNFNELINPCTIRIKIKTELLYKDKITMILF